MPYIKKQRREAILAGAKLQGPGELNFAITTIVDGYLAEKGGIRYAHLNEVVGAMECAKLELYRRVAAPYEDVKIKDAGGVLNLAITTIVDSYLAERGGIGYAELNEVVGAMECAKLELYRRVAAPYEDIKIKKAGDVYKSKAA